ncbi:hypothetical protein [Microbacterium sp. Se63.02b]|uniref:hypothetical protein n=1 Tax=Microbacterium sp. Se63.02b TaxID=2709304 RepID=UPI001AEE73A0|nr:hypothetical protein [Microbacterium sp. Se63.02b]
MATGTAFCSLELVARDGRFACSGVESVHCCEHLLAFIENPSELRVAVLELDKFLAPIARLLSTRERSAKVFEVLRPGTGGHDTLLSGLYAKPRPRVFANDSSVTVSPGELSSMSAVGLTGRASSARSHSAAASLGELRTLRDGAGAVEDAVDVGICLVDGAGPRPGQRPIASVDLIVPADVRDPGAVDKVEECDLAGGREQHEPRLRAPGPSRSDATAFDDASVAEAL